MELLEQKLLRAADTGIDGFNFETADVDYITCHCEKCEKRFQSASETAYENKPTLWSLEHLNLASDLLADSYPDLWLNCEFAIQRFCKPPYDDCERLLELNRNIDPQMTVVWAEETAPSPEIVERLVRDRENIGFYIRSGAIRGWEEVEALDPFHLLPISKRLMAQNPVCVFYRSYRPTGQWISNMGAAARILKNPGLSEEEVREAR